MPSCDECASSWLLTKKCWVFARSLLLSLRSQHSFAFRQIRPEYQRGRNHSQSRDADDTAIPAWGEFGGMIGGKHVSGGGARCGFVLCV